MNKPVLFAALVGSVVCPRCGNRMQRDDRNCAQCGAFNSVVANRDCVPSTEPPSSVSGTFEVRQPASLQPDVVEPDGDDRHLMQWSPPPPPRMKRTLSVKAALLGACAVGVIACGLTYLSFGTWRAESDAKSDLPSDVAYMTPKALREINARLGTADHPSDLSPEPAPAQTDPAQAALAPDAQPDGERDASPDAGALNAAANPQSSFAKSEVPAAATTHAGTRAATPSHPAFPDASDPDALERAIRQYGWKPLPDAAASH